MTKRTEFVQGRYRLQCSSRAEASAVSEDIREYFQGGITLGPGAVVVDAGANIGQFSVYALESCGGDAIVYAFEPIPATAKTLAENFERIDRHQLKAFALGLGATDGRREFAYHAQGTILSSGFPDAVDADAQKLKETILRNCAIPDASPRIRSLGRLPKSWRARFLDFAMAKHFRFERVECPLHRLSTVIRAEGIDRIDLLKINVERMEREVLEGIDEGHWPLIRQVVAEVHDIDDRVGWIRRQLERHGLGMIRVMQNPIYRDSDTFLLSAWRPDQVLSAMSDG